MIPTLRDPSLESLVHCHQGEHLGGRHLRKDTTSVTFRNLSRRCEKSAKVREVPSAVVREVRVFREVLS